MIQITTIEDILMAITFTFLALYLIATAIQSKPSWFMSKALIKSRQIQKDYDKMLQSRKDMLVNSGLKQHHYYWSQSSGQKKKMKQIEKEIVRVDEQLRQMRSQYELVRKGLPVPLKMF